MFSLHWTLQDVLWLIHGNSSTQPALFSLQTWDSTINRETSRMEYRKMDTHGSAPQCETMDPVTPRLSCLFSRSLSFSTSLSCVHLSPPLHYTPWGKCFPPCLPHPAFPSHFLFHLCFHKAHCSAILLKHPCLRASGTTWPLGFPLSSLDTPSRCPWLATPQPPKWTDGVLQRLVPDQFFSIHTLSLDDVIHFYCFK